MKEIQLRGGGITIVDDADFERLSKWKWFKQNNRYKDRVRHYAARNINVGYGRTKTIMMHREIMGITDPKMFIDHRDMDSLNNQRCNLRICTRSQNQANIKSRIGSSSKYLGVSLDKRSNRWNVWVRKNNNRFYVGGFKNEDDAALAYNRKAIEIHGEFANLNIIQP